MCKIKLYTLTPLSAQISASNFRYFTQMTARPQSHSARGGRGVNRKHHSAERCDLRFGFQSAQKFSKAHGKIEITRGAAERFESQILNHTSPQSDVCD